MRRRTFLTALAAGAAVVATGSDAWGWHRVGVDTVLMCQSRTPSKDVPGILQHAGVNAMSQSLSWSSIERTPGVYDFSAFDVGVKLAHEHGAGFQPRVRGGGQTPTFHKGRTMSVTTGLSHASVIAPVPVNTDGKPNWTWLNGFRNLCNALDDWCNANLNGNDGPIHRTWFGGASAEIFISPKMLTLPGVTQARVEQAYLECLHIAASARVNKANELSISGLEAGPPLKSLQAVIHKKMGSYPRFWTQRNGFTDGTGGTWGGPTPPPHGLQMVKAFKPDGAAFNWTEVYSKAVRSFSTMPATQRGFLEVYEQSFTGKGGASLYAQAAAHA